MITSTKYYIYKATNLINSKSYIGFTRSLRDRKYQHENSARKGSGFAFHAAIRKYGSENFSWEILYCGWDKRYMLEAIEPGFIEYYDPDLVTGHGYNMRKKVLG